MPTASTPALDRRLSYAEALFAEGDMAAAADLLAETLVDAPDWVAGWFRYGEMAEAAGQTEGATAAYDRVVAIDPTDRFGATLKRDLLRPVSVVDRAPSAFVEALFDQYAPRFEASLVGKLDYCGPDLLTRALGGRRFADAMDLGCGTGLMGVELRGRVDRLAGCDISEGMLIQARAKHIYDLLFKQDLTQMVDPRPSYDLIVAADVFIYLGALEHIVAWAAGSILPGGVLAFTVEIYDAPGFALRGSRRFAHSATYITDLLAVAGFRDVTLTKAVLRMDREQPIAAYVVIAKAAPRVIAPPSEVAVIAG